MGSVASKRVDIEQYILRTAIYGILDPTRIGTESLPRVKCDDSFYASMFAC